MCGQNPELRARMIRELAEEFRNWLRRWRQRYLVTGGLSPQRIRSRVKPTSPV